MNQASGKEPHFLMPHADAHEFNNRSDTIQSPGSSIGWHENILDASIPDFEHSVQQSEFDPTTPVGRFGSRRPRSSSLSNIRSTPEQRRGAERAECMATETDDTSHPFDERAVAYIERLLAAIGRLRNERDDLRRNVEFLEMEAKVATETLGTNEMDPNEQPGSDVSVGTRDLLPSGIESESPNSPTFRQLGLSSTASAITIGHMQQQADPAACQFSMELDSLREQLEERNEQLGAMAVRLEVAEKSVEVATAEQDDLQAQVSRLLSKEEEHFRVMERLKNSHDEIQDTLARNEASLAEATASLEEVASERDALTLHIADLQNDLFCAQQAVSEAESRYSDLQFHRISPLSSDEVVDALRLQVEELEDRVLRRTEQIGIHQHDIKRLETNLRLQEERVGEMTLDLDMLNAQKEAMVEDCADAREARDEALQKVETLEVEVEELEARAEILEKNLEMLQNQRDEEVTSLVGITFKFISESRVARQPLTTTKVSRSINDDTFDTVRQITLALAMSQLELKRTTRSLGIVNQERSSLLTQVGELRDQLDAVRRKKPPTDDLERRILAQHTDTLADLEHRLQVTLDELEEARRLHANAEALHLEVRRESSRLEQELADRVESDADHMRVAEEAKVEQERLMAKYVTEIDLLQNQLDDLGKQARQANESRTQLESLHQQTIDALAETEQMCEGHSRAARRSHEIILHLDDEVARRTDQLVSLKSQLDASSKEIDRVTRRLEEELQSRALENERHTKELASAAECAENTRSELRQGLDDTLRQLEQSRVAFESLQEEKSTLQMEMTDLAAEIQRSISLCRFLESQVKDYERTITSLKEALETTRANLASSEKSGKAAEISLSLQSAQHERTMSNILRELATLRAKPALEESVSKLEEKNAELEELLKSKCAEIEENDDRFLDLLKEKKKLANKIEVLSRKVQNLQNKLATGQSPCSIPPPAAATHAPTIPSASTPTNPIHSIPRAKSATSTTHPFPTRSPNMYGTPVSRDRPTNRTISGPSSFQRSKTPERKQVMPNVNRTPERRKSRATPDPERPPVLPNLPNSRTPERRNSRASPDSSQSLGKKRKAPDDFETGEGVPPRAFTADCLPGDDLGTPRLRRVLQSVSGFTPVRTRLPLSPKKEVDAKKEVYIAPKHNIADVTNNPRPSSDESQSEKPTKRSWLGKIKGQASIRTLQYQ